MAFWGVSGIVRRNAGAAAPLVRGQPVEQRQDLPRNTDGSRCLTSDVRIDIVVVVGSVTAITEVESQLSDSLTGSASGVQIRRPDSGMWISSRALAAVVAKTILGQCKDRVIGPAYCRSEGRLIGWIGQHPLSNGKEEAPIESTTVLGCHDSVDLRHIDV